MPFTSDKTRQGAAGASTDFTIPYSCKFDGSSSRLNFTAGTPTNALIYTWSFWAKRGNLGSYQQIFAAGPVAGGGDTIRFSSNDKLYINFNDGNSGQLETTAVFRDTSAWYHIVFAVDTTQSTDTNRVKVYVNGVQHTSFSTSTIPAEDYDTPAFNTSGKTFNIGRGHPDEHYFDGCLAEFHFIDGTQLTPSSFGEAGDYGEWKAKEVEGLTYGNNGFYLDFADAADLGDDESGNTNDFTETNIAAADQMLDTPTNNFATLNPLDPESGQTLSEGNLKTVMPDNKNSIANMFVSSGKWYWEVKETNVGGAAIFSESLAMAGAGDGNKNGTAGNYDFSSLHGTIYYNTSTDTTPSTGSDGDIVGVALDLDNNKIYWHVNGTYISLSGGQQNPTTAANPIVITQTTEAFAPTISAFSTDPSFTANFGQDSSFAGAETAQGNGGAGEDFYYTPPTGFKALCTSNLPAVAVVPSEHFNVVAYTGDGVAAGSGGRDVAVGFQPDFVWIKNRPRTESHNLFDVLRGVNLIQFSNSASADYVHTETLLSFDSNGFNLGSENSVNRDTEGYISWNWKANGSGSSNTDGSINTTATSANVDSGFSISTFTGTGSNATVGHGLSKAPEMVIVKHRNSASYSDWTIYHASNTAAPATDFLQLNTTDATSDDVERWNDTAPTADVFSVGVRSEVNGSSETYVAYCFHSVDGYSKCGTYNGNADTDGTFVYTGFRPAFIMMKQTDAADDWGIYDNKRVNGFNEDGSAGNAVLYPNATNAEEAQASRAIDILSNGFKLRTSNPTFNESPDPYIYLAFAETPFKYSNAR